MKLLAKLSPALVLALLSVNACQNMPGSKASATARGGTIFYKGGEPMPTIDLNCTPYSISGLGARLQGMLVGTGKLDKGYAVGGQLELTVYEPGKKTRTFKTSVTGTFTPPDGHGTFKTNYISADIYGAEPMNALSITLAKESGDMPM